MELHLKLVRHGLLIDQVVRLHVMEVLEQEN